MNKLSSCEIFQVSDKSYKGSISKTLQEIAKNLGKYTVDVELYDFIVKGMRSYRYPLAKLIVKSAQKGEIKPLLLIEPKDKKDKQITLPSTIPTLCLPDGSKGFVDVSPRASYIRNSVGRIESIKIKELDLYAYLQMAFVDMMCRRYAPIIKSSRDIVKNTAVAYSRIFSKCIDRTFPISAKSDKFNVSIFLTAVFAVKQFFEYSMDDAVNFVFSSGICKRNEIEGDCKVLIENKLEFENISEFLEVYSYEFSDYIRSGDLNLRLLVGMFTKMYGPNSFFTIEHGISFINMITAVPINTYNDKQVGKAVKAQSDAIMKSFLKIFSRG